MGARTLRSGGRVTASAVQVDPQVDPQVGLENKEKNVQRTLEMINDAADHGVTLIVLPELVNTGYGFATREEAYDHAEPVPGGPTTQAWAALARERGLHLVGGLAELDGVRMYDTAVLIGPDG